MHTADANVIAQITARGTDFPKATHLYRTVDIYGQNILCSEGAAWRYHRKLTSPLFAEKNIQLVWKETLDQSQAMLESWLGPGGNGRTIRRVAGDTMRLSLNVISRAGLGQKMEWQTAAEESRAPGKSIPGGHTMSFTYSLRCLLDNLLYVMILPAWFLRNSPFAIMRKSYEAYDELGKYMKEMVAAKKTTIRSGASESSTSDIIEQLIKGQDEWKNGKSQSPTGFADSEVMGNLFVFVIAGHETSANSIHFSLLLLALHPEIQQEVQKELTEVFQGRPISEWDYDRDLPRLLTGMLCAVLNEQLRLIAPVIAVPKAVHSVPQQLVVDGKEVTVPANTMVRLCIPSVHRNPKFWPHGPPKYPQKPYFPLDNLDNDLEEFKPERWVKGKNRTADAVINIHATETKTADTEDPETPASLYSPIRGSYIPFSEGQRACLGRRFAQVEILAALSVILTQYSVELAVDEWASDEEVERMTKEQKRETWGKAEEKAHWIWQNKMGCIITLQLRGACVPMRFVRRGEERFRDL
ncbi:hypothetical protein FGG08_007089 [Glutinoglossum americanum]|uniref:Cytochrome P450 n=1 Tax=Glutinoglossum americanum TaxID=1670608 RepID=A0A9P8I424_9PEZI|nr:hypothetical protein FGG08_007089 [Glutinoglossum americanum]